MPATTAPASRTSTLGEAVLDTFHGLRGRLGTLTRANPSFRRILKSAKHDEGVAEI